MLIKAGVLAATAAAGLLAVSPLAFAGDYNGGHDSDHGHHSHSHGGHDETASCRQGNSARDERSGGGGGLINISDVGVQVPVQACNNSVLEGVLGILSSGQRNDDSH